MPHRASAPPSAPNGRPRVDRGGPGSAARRQCRALGDRRHLRLRRSVIGRHHPRATRPDRGAGHRGRALRDGACLRDQRRRLDEDVARAPGRPAQHRARGAADDPAAPTARSSPSVRNWRSAEATATPTTPRPRVRRRVRPQPGRRGRIHGVRVNSVAPGPTDTPMSPRTRPGAIRPTWPLFPRDGCADPTRWPAVHFVIEEAGFCVGEVLSPNCGAVI